MKFSKYFYIGIIALLSFIVSLLPFVSGIPAVVIILFGGIGAELATFLGLEFFAYKLNCTEHKAWIYLLPCSILQIIATFVLGAQTVLVFYAVGMLMVATALTNAFSRSTKPSFLKFIIPLLIANFSTSIFGSVLFWAGAVKDIFITLNSVIPLTFLLFVLSYIFERIIKGKQQPNNTDENVIYIDK